MPNVAEILKRKGTRVQTIGKEATVLEAAHLMNRHKIGSLIVNDEERVIGIFTERDILQRVVAEQRDPARTLVGEVMTTELVCCTEQTTIEEARGAMMTRRIRHMPLLDDDGRLRGLISIGDLNAWDASHQEETIYHLQEYIYGRV